MKVFTKVILATQQQVCTFSWHVTQYLASLHVLVTGSNPHFWNTRVGSGRMVNDKLSFGSSYLFMFKMSSKATTHTQWAYLVNFWILNSFEKTFKMLKMTQIIKNIFFGFLFFFFAIFGFCGKVF
jgi:hypothetical protein